MCLLAVDNPSVHYAAARQPSDAPAASLTGTLLCLCYGCCVLFLSVVLIVVDITRCICPRCLFVGGGAVVDVHSNGVVCLSCCRYCSRECQVKHWKQHRELCDFVVKTMKAAAETTPTTETAATTTKAATTASAVAAAGAGVAE